MSFKLVATDLDGTILLPDAQISQRTLDALRAVQDRGAIVVPVTARSPRTAGPIAASLGVHDGWAICGSGSLLYDLGARQIVDSHPLPGDVAARLVHALRETNPGVLFAAERHMDLLSEPGFSLPPTTVALEDRAERWATEAVTKLIVWHPEADAETLAAAIRAVLGEAGMVGWAGAGNWIEVLGSGASKAAMLEKLCRRLGVARDEVIAFGDWRPDIPLLQWAGHGVAMANALPEVIDVSDEVAPSNEEDGVAAVLERLLAADQISGVAAHA